jgi:hypothetical protein
MRVIPGFLAALLLAFAASFAPALAQGVPISGLPNGTPAATSLIPIVVNGVTSKATVQQILTTSGVTLTNLPTNQFAPGAMTNGQCLVAASTTAFVGASCASLLAGSYVTLSPGAAQTGFLNLTGASVFGSATASTLTASGTLIVGGNTIVSALDYMLCNDTDETTALTAAVDAAISANGTLLIPPLPYICRADGSIIPTYSGTSSPTQNPLRVTGLAGPGGSGIADLSYPADLSGSVLDLRAPGRRFDSRGNGVLRFDHVTLYNGSPSYTATHASMTAGSTALAIVTGSGDAPFTSAMVGQAVAVHGAGMSGAYLATTIASFTDSQHVVLTLPAQVTVSSPTVATYGGAPGCFIGTTNTILDLQYVLFWGGGPGGYASYDDGACWGGKGFSVTDALVTAGSAAITIGSNDGPFDSSIANVNPSAAWALAVQNAGTAYTATHATMSLFAGSNVYMKANSSVLVNDWDGTLVFGLPNVNTTLGDSLFTAQMVGSTVTVQGVGVSGAPVTGVIMSVTDANHVIVNFNATTTLASPNSATYASNLLTINSGGSGDHAFTYQYVGTNVVVNGAGASGANLSGTITQWYDSNDALLSVSASTAVSGATATYTAPLITSISSVTDGQHATMHDLAVTSASSTNAYWSGYFSPNAGSQFQGYGSNAHDNWFSHIKHIHSFYSGVNDINIGPENVNGDSGSAELDSAPFLAQANEYLFGGGTSGVKIHGSTVELIGYKYFLTMRHGATKYLIDEPGLYDNSYPLGAIHTGDPSVGNIDYHPGALSAQIPPFNLIDGPGAPSSTYCSALTNVPCFFPYGVAFGINATLTAQSITSNGGQFIAGSEMFLKSGGNNPIMMQPGGGYIGFQNSSNTTVASIRTDQYGAIVTGSGTVDPNPAIGAGGLFYNTSTGLQISNGTSWSTVGTVTPGAGAVTLSPSGQQTGYLNLSGAGTFGGTVTGNLFSGPGTSLTLLPANQFNTASFTSGACLLASSATAIGSAAGPCVTTTGTQTLTGITTFLHPAFADSADNTKIADFSMANIATGMTRTYTFPNVGGVFITSGDTGTVTNTMLANSTISGVALGGTLGQLTFGAHLSVGTLSSYNGSTLGTIVSDATSANTASTIVARDASGNFSAGALTLATPLSVGNGGSGSASPTGATCANNCTTSGSFPNEVLTNSLTPTLTNATIGSLSLSANDLVSGTASNLVLNANGTTHQVLINFNNTTTGGLAVFDGGPSNVATLKYNSLSLASGGCILDYGSTTASTLTDPCTTAFTGTTTIGGKKPTFASCTDTTVGVITCSATVAYTSSTTYACGMSYVGPATTTGTATGITVVNASGTSVTGTIVGLSLATGTATLLFNCLGS